MWFKVDDNLAFHRKVVAAGNAAMGLWVRAGSWCAQHLTDGFIPDHMINVLGTATQRAKLVKVGLWEEVDGGCQFHGWNEKGRQPTSKSVLEERAKAAARQERYRRGSYREPQVSAPSDAVTSPSVTPSVTGVVTPTPTRPDPIEEQQLSLAALGAIDNPPAAKPVKPAKPDPMERFAEFYAVYPRKQDRRAAERAWRAAINRGADPEKIISAARIYAKSQVGNERRYIKLPATWLNAASYDDEPERPRFTVINNPNSPWDGYRIDTSGSPWSDAFPESS